jgi:hypothetical protein
VNDGAQLTGFMENGENDPSRANTPPGKLLKHMHILDDEHGLMSGLPDHTTMVAIAKTPAGSTNMKKKAMAPIDELFSPPLPVTVGNRRKRGVVTSTTTPVMSYSEKKQAQLGVDSCNVAPATPSIKSKPSISPRSNSRIPGSGGGSGTTKLSSRSASYNQANIGILENTNETDLLNSTAKTSKPEVRPASTSLSNDSKAPLTARFSGKPASTSASISRSGSATLLATSSMRPVRPLSVNSANVSKPSTVSSTSSGRSRLYGGTGPSKISSSASCCDLQDFDDDNSVCDSVMSAASGISALTTQSFQPRTVVKKPASTASKIAIGSSAVNSRAGLTNGTSKSTGRSNSLTAPAPKPATTRSTRASGTLTSSSSVSTSSTSNSNIINKSVPVVTKATVAKMRGISLTQSVPTTSSPSGSKVNPSVSASHPKTPAKVASATTASVPLHAKERTPF